MEDLDQAIDEFWNWFRNHRAEFDSLVNPDTPFWDVAVNELKRINRLLWIELSHPDGGTRDFIITVEGHCEAFPIVEAIIARAPQIEGWNFIALKPPMGFDFTTNYEGITFHPSAMWFRILGNSYQPQGLALQIGLPNLTTANRRQAQNAMLIILDTALGERAAATLLHAIDVVPLPNNPSASGYTQLPKLPALIARNL
jgi:hypothetical protein